jgi:hypothetical protein
MTRRIIAIKLQPDDSLVIHPLTWLYLYNRWIDKGIGPQYQIPLLMPDYASLAFRRLPL